MVKIDITPQFDSVVINHISFYAVHFHMFCLKSAGTFNFDYLNTASSIMTACL